MHAGRRQARTSVLAAGLLATIVAAVLGSTAGASPLPVVDPTVKAARESDPVVLKGSDFPGWAVPANQTVKLPLMDLASCQTFDDQCAHNNYAQPEVDTQTVAPQAGIPTGRLLGYRWNPNAGKTGKFVQIPFQVDEMFVRYLDNSASGFSVYSGDDQHLTYAFDREGFRYWGSDPNNPCKAVPGPGEPKTTPDPVPGLDTNDELAFMARDAGPQAPAAAALPKGIVGAREVKVTDPTAASTNVNAVYVMQASATGPKAAYNASNGYVHYQRDPAADYYEKSQSSYSGYGNARVGTVCDANGNPIIDPQTGQPEQARRRPRDWATVTTPRYSFRYDGRWLMTNVQISPHDNWQYGPDLVDRWKARAFAQDPGSDTPCCGYEEEDTNWGGSSTLLGERVGPVRAIRETWGADSGTNVIRRETFYRDQVQQKSYLRVHVIPPLDGIYAQWDFNAGRMTRYYSSRLMATQPQGVAVDGQNDEALGNFDDSCNQSYDQNDTSALDQTVRSTIRTVPGTCSSNQLAGQSLPYHQSIDLSDPTLSDANAALGWNVTSGPYGSIVDRIRIDQATDLTPGGAAQSMVAEPYYRDDSCFDDGTGSDPGPKLHLRSADEPAVAADGTPRTCWKPSDGLPNGSDHYYQGSIGTHGLHLLFLADSDNARQTVPVDEIVSSWQMVMLPGQRDATAGEQYGRSFEKPLVTAVVPYQGG
jgi:uncharacterized membrane protein